MRRMRRWAWVPLWLALFGCAMPFDVPYAEHHSVPAQHYVWWGEVHECLGRRMTLLTYQFWIVPGSVFDAGDVRARGAWSSPRLYVAETYQFNEYVIKHEQLHALGYTHPRNQWPYPPPFNTCTE